MFLGVFELPTGSAAIGLLERVMALKTIHFPMPEKYKSFLEIITPISSQGDNNALHVTTMLWVVR